jgi:dihydrofolate reductase
VIRLIAAMDDKRGISGGHGIPWQGRIPADTKYFREQTAHGVIVMGYRTYEEFAQTLHDRENFVVCRPGTSLRPGFVGVPDVVEFLTRHSDETVWVIGGAVVYATTLPRADELYITQLDGDFKCTTFFPTFDDAFVLADDLGSHHENGIAFRFEIWRQKQDVSEKKPG